MLPIKDQKRDLPHVIYKIPIEFLTEFTDAPYEAMRDILAIPAVVKDALFPNPRVLEERIDKLRQDPVTEENLYRWLNGKIESPKSFNIFNEHLAKPDNYAAYFMHVDLALVEDATGVSLVHRDTKTGKFIVDFIFAIESKKIVEKRIPIGKVKYIAIYLKYNLGYNISKVTYDGFQSAESIQELIDNGIDAKVQSVDRTAAPYDTLRDLIHSDQISFYDYKSEEVNGLNMSLKRELLNLTKDKRTGKVDHVTKGSKDLSDALAGAIYTSASENFEYTGINDFSMHQETVTDSGDPYIFEDGYSTGEEMSIRDMVMANAEKDMDFDMERNVPDYKFYEDDI